MPRMSGESISSRLHCRSPKLAQLGSHGGEPGRLVTAVDQPRQSVVGRAESDPLPTCEVAEAQRFDRLPNLLIDSRSEQLYVFFQQQSILHQLFCGFGNGGGTIAIVGVALSEGRPRIVILEPLLARRREWNH
jgi:hypothetical protein